jgi:hypothetical protein
VCLGLNVDHLMDVKLLVVFEFESFAVKRQGREPSSTIEDMLLACNHMSLRQSHCSMALSTLFMCVCGVKFSVVLHSILSTCLWLADTCIFFGFTEWLALPAAVTSLSALCQ